MAFTSFHFRGFSPDGEDEYFLPQDIVPVGEDFVARGTASWTDPAGKRVFRSALLALDGELRLKRWVWLPSQEPSDWNEGSYVLSQLDDDTLHLANEVGRGMLLSAAADRIIAVYDGEIDVDSNPHPPASVARSKGGVYLGVAGIPMSGRRSVACTRLVRGTGDGLGLPTEWETLSPEKSPQERSKLHQPWVHQILALPRERWLVGVVTAGRTGSAYPSKSIGFRYSVVDADGEERGSMKYRSADRSLHVYNNVGDALFPSTRHPFYPIRYSPAVGLVHKLLPALLFFNQKGSVTQHLDLSQRGLTGLKKFELRGVSDSGIGVFIKTADNAVFTVDLSDPDSRAKNLSAGLKGYRKALKTVEDIPVAEELVATLTP